MNRNEVIAECRERRGQSEISDRCARTIMQLHAIGKPAVVEYLHSGTLPADDTDSRRRVTISGETKLWRDMFASYDSMPKEDRLMGDMLGTYFTQATNKRLFEDEAWREAYRIAYIGASNPVACASSLARSSADMLHALGTDGIKQHHALRAIAGHLAFLYGYGFGPDIELLDEVEANAKRLGIFVS